MKDIEMLMGNFVQMPLVAAKELQGICRQVRTPSNVPMTGSFSEDCEFSASGSRSCSLQNSRHDAFVGLGPTGDLPSSYVAKVLTQQLRNTTPQNLQTATRGLLREARWCQELSLDFHQRASHAQQHKQGTSASHWIRLNSWGCKRARH